MKVNFIHSLHSQNGTNCLLASCLMGSDLVLYTWDELRQYILKDRSLILCFDTKPPILVKHAGC